MDGACFKRPVGPTPLPPVYDSTPRHGVPMLAPWFCCVSVLRTGLRSRSKRICLLLPASRPAEPAGLMRSSTIPRHRLPRVRRTKNGREASRPRSGGALPALQPQNHFERSSARRIRRRAGCAHSSLCEAAALQQVRKRQHHGNSSRQERSRCPTIAGLAGFD